MLRARGWRWIADGRFLALDVATVANLGAYLSSGGPGSSTNAPANAMGSGYVIPAIFMDVQGVFTNTVPIDAYRGAGKPEVNYLIERLIDAGRSPPRLRSDRAAPAQPDREFPYRKALGTVIDCGRFAANIDDVIVVADHAGFAGTPRRVRGSEGMLRGIGITCFMETARGAPNEGAELRFDDDGRVALLVGTQCNGMGHETAYAQIAADLLGLPIETFRYVQADTAEVRAGNGHGGARSMHMGGAALCRAIGDDDRQGQPDRRPAAAGPPAQIVFADGRFSVRDDPARAIDLLSVARPRAIPPTCRRRRSRPRYLRLEPARHHHLPERMPHRRGRNRSGNRRRHAAALHRGRRFRHPDQSDADHRSGARRRRAGHRPGDAGAHRLRSAKSGQMLSGSFMDYPLPRADDLPDLDITLTGVPTSANPLGVKGSGQAGAMAAPQTIICAVLDALAPLGVTHIDMPATPERVWRAIQAAQRQEATR